MRSPVLTGNQNGMPWWVRAITFFGVPAAIALYLVYALAGAHTRDVIDMSALVKAHVQEAAESERIHQQHERALERILIAICINGTTTFEGRANCLQP